MDGKLFGFCCLFLQFIGCVLADAPIGVYWGSGAGILGFIILILDIIAIVEVLGGHAGMLSKLCWILFILFFPIIGLIFYCILGRSAIVHHHGYSHV